MKYTITLVFFLLILQANAQPVEPLAIKILDTLPANTIKSLTNPQRLSGGEYFNLDHPHAMLDKRNPKEDICTFRLIRNGRDLAWFYVGGNNTFPIKGYGVSFFIKLNDTTHYRFPYFQDYGIKIFEKVLGVSFGDLNSDGYTDITVLGQFYEGYGSQGGPRSAPQYLFEIYFGSEKGFYGEKDMMGKLGLGQKKRIDMKDISKAYRKKG